MADSNLAGDVVKQVAERARDLAKQIADTVGAPADASKLSRSEITRLWNLPNPQANPMQVQQLIAAGQHSQAVDLAFPWRNKLIGKGSPQAMVDRSNRFAEMASSGDLTST